MKRKYYDIDYMKTQCTETAQKYALDELCSYYQKIKDIEEKHMRYICFLISNYGVRTRDIQKEEIPKYKNSLIIPTVTNQIEVMKINKLEKQIQDSINYFISIGFNVREINK